MNANPAETTPRSQDPAELQAEIERLRRQLAAAGVSADGSASVGAPRAGGRHIWRSALSAFLILLAVILAPLSAVSVWASQEINNQDVYVARMTAVIESPAVRSAISTRATNTLLEKADLQGLASDAASTIAENRNLTDRQSLALSLLADSAAGAAANLVGTEVGDFVNSDQFEQVWVSANTAAHESLVAWLSGDDSRALQVQGDALVVDLSALLTQVKQRLVDRGVAFADRIPTDTDATFVLAQSDDIGKVQGAYAGLSTLGVWLPIIVAALAIAGILVATKRRVALMGLGIGLLIVASLSLVAKTIGEQFYVNALPDSVNVEAAEVVFTSLVAPLEGILWAGVALGIIFIVAAALMGGGRFATDSRRRLAGVGASARGVLHGWGVNLDGVRSWAVPAATGLRIGAAAVAAVVLLLIPLKTASAVLWTLAGLLVALAVIEIVAGGSDEEAVTAPSTPPVGIPT